MCKTRVSGLCRPAVRPQTHDEAIALLSGAALPLWRLLAPFLVHTGEATSDDWIKHTESPLGERKTRQMCCRGIFLGARKVGRTWLIPRAEMEAYIREHGSSRAANDNGDEGANDAVRDLAAKLGYSLTSDTARSRRGKP